MAIRNKLILATSLLALAATNVYAQTAPVAGHPRENEVNQRLDNQEQRTDKGVASGTINAKQEARDNARDAKVSQEESADEAKNGGKLTKREQRKMNRQLDHNSTDIKAQKELPGSATAAH